MDETLRKLRALADPTRLRLLALCARGTFCVTELTEVLGQSQPRLSRHLKILTDAAILACSREGTRAWFRVGNDSLVNAALAAIPAQDPALAADARATARVLAERARAASAQFQASGADWDEMRALSLNADAVERQIIQVLGEQAPNATTLLDIGTGTGRLLELCAPRMVDCIGIDASPAMLALARTRLARKALRHCRVQQADAYHLSLPDETFDVVTLQMLLHHAEAPGDMLLEAARVLAPNGRLLVIDLTDDPAPPSGLRWPGFADADMRSRLADAGLCLTGSVTIFGTYTVAIWTAKRAASDEGALAA